MGAFLLALALAQGFQPGDRVFAKAGAAVLAAPRAGAKVVRPLLPGDELALLPPDEDDFHDFPAGWLAVATPEAPSRRGFSGFVRAAEVGAGEPAAAARRAALRGEIERLCAELDARRAPFSTLKEQAVHWRSVPGGGSQGEELSRRLATYMGSEVTPRALDALDRLSELRALDPGEAARLGRRLEELSKSFRP